MKEPEDYDPFENGIETRRFPHVEQDYFPEDLK